jgi:hypothetical protein
MPQPSASQKPSRTKSVGFRFFRRAPGSDAAAPERARGYLPAIRLPARCKPRMKVASLAMVGRDYEVRGTCQITPGPCCCVRQSICNVEMMDGRCQLTAKDVCGVRGCVPSATNVSLSAFQSDGCHARSDEQRSTSPVQDAHRLWALDDHAGPVSRQVRNRARLRRRGPGRSSRPPAFGPRNLREDQGTVGERPRRR